jgi:hypothetical protein
VLTKTNYNEWGLVMKVKLQARQMLDAISYNDVNFDEDVADFKLHLSILVQQMVRYNDNDIDKEKAIEKFLHTIPKKYTQIVLAMETLLDLSKLTIEVKCRLKVVNDQDQPPPVKPVTISGKLLFTEKQWLAR